SLSLLRESPGSPLLPYTTLFRSDHVGGHSFGIATDGRRFEAYGLRDGRLEKFDELDLADVDDAGAAAWIDSYLFSESGLVPTAEDVVRRFGPTSAVFLATRERLHELWRAIATDS